MSSDPAPSRECNGHIWPPPAGATQWWLAELDRYGNPTLVDGAHDSRDGAEKALRTWRLCGLNKGWSYAIAEVRLNWPWKGLPEEDTDV